MGTKVHRIRDRRGRKRETIDCCQLIVLETSEMRTNCANVQNQSVTFH